MLLLRLSTARWSATHKAKVRRNEESLHDMNGMGAGMGRALCIRVRKSYGILDDKTLDRVQSFHSAVGSPV
jgi:hypothetical protein